MNAKLIPVVVVVLLVVVVLGLGQPFFIVDEREQVVVTRLNKPVHVIVGDFRKDDFAALKDEILQSATSSGGEGAIDLKSLHVSQGAGLYWKMPFIDAAQSFPDTMLEYDAKPVLIVTKDKKQLMVDNFARWRIENPLLFWVRVRSEGVAHARLDDVIYSIMREELGKNNLIEIIRTTKVFEETGIADALGADVDIAVGGSSGSTVTSNPMSEILERGREEIMSEVSRRADIDTRRGYGIKLVDVRIKRAELPPTNLQAVFGRMIAERDRISKGYRSEGQERRDIIEGETDKQVLVLLAEAERDAQTLRGEGDAQSLRIYAEAFSQNVELYEFIQGLEVMKQSTPTGSELIVGLDSSIYDMLRPPTSNK